MFASFKYLLTKKLNIDMAGIIHVDLDTPNGVAKARVDGVLRFDQAAPILIDSITRTIYVKNPINSDDYAQIGLPGILEHYFARSGKYISENWASVDFFINFVFLSCSEKLKFDY